MAEDDIIMGDNVSESPKVNEKEYNKIELSELKGKGSKVKFSQDIFGNIPVEVTVVLGKSKIDLQKVLQLSKGDVVELNKLAGESVDLMINGQIIANGEVVAVGDNYGIKVTKVISK